MPAVVASRDVPSRAVSQKTLRVKAAAGGTGEARERSGEAAAGVEAPADFRNTLDQAMQGKPEAKAPVAEAAVLPSKGGGKRAERQNPRKTGAEVQEVPGEEGDEPIADAETPEALNPEEEATPAEDSESEADMPEKMAEPTVPDGVMVSVATLPAAAVPVRTEDAPEASGGGATKAPVAPPIAVRADPMGDAEGREAVKSKSDAPVAKAPAAQQEPSKDVKPAVAETIDTEGKGASPVQTEGVKLPEPMKAQEPVKAKGMPLAKEIEPRGSKGDAAAPVVVPTSGLEAWVQAGVDTEATALPTAPESPESRSKLPVSTPPTVAVMGEQAPRQGVEARAEVAATAQETPVHDPHETFDQVVLGLRTKMDARNGKAEIELNPPNLGKVNVSMTLENGVLTAQFQSSSDAVRGLLRDNLEKLKTVLEGRGVAVERLTVQAPEAAASRDASQGQAFGDAARDGRSGNQYQRDARSGNRRPEGDLFARLFRGQAAGSPLPAPIDLVG